MGVSQECVRVCSVYNGVRVKGSCEPILVLPCMASVSAAAGDVHSLLKLDSRHFGVVAASDYKSLGE